MWVRYKNTYKGPFVRYVMTVTRLLPLRYSHVGQRRLESRIRQKRASTAVARFDNLGTGASGAAVQCMNILMGIDETTGLRLIFPTAN